MNFYNKRTVQEFIMELQLINNSLKKADRKGVKLTQSRMERKQWLEQQINLVHGNPEPITEPFDEGLNDN